MLQFALDFICHSIAIDSWLGYQSLRHLNAGKAGAIVGAFGFGQLFLTAGISTTLAILAATNFLGKSVWPALVDAADFSPEL